jgi:hypothetical protein
MAAELLLAALLLAGSMAFGDEYFSERGFSIDLPEGFDILESDGSSSFSFGSPDGAVLVDIVVYPASRFMSAKAGADDTARRLSGRGSFRAFEYGSHDAAIGELGFGTGSSALRGYGLFVNDVQSPRGDYPATSGSKPALYDLAVIAYAPAASWPRYRDVVASAIDGFSMDGRRAAPGPLGASARAAIAGTAGSVAARKATATIHFGAALVQAEWRASEAALAQDLVEREYRVLSAYASAPELLDAAVARFYRMVFRDAAPSLDALALDLSAAWETGAWAGTPRSPTLAQPRIPAPGLGGTAVTGPRFGASAEPRAYAEALLSWVQGFRYERDPAGSDVVNPISAAFEGRGDCDSRALVMAILLRRENIRSILMVSLEHEHALAAVDAPGPGARFPFGKRLWLVAETTATVGIGRIDASQADPTDWIGVEFPD